ncbi:MAG TPA: GNAT family N-acetyltransferase [Candidatus Baltobacteraceae bacterium]|nr:GNAT family N-acetyltransferase [Candidatus Baltobacteraceae bacterium]
MDLPDGYLDLRPGKIANVVTNLEMFERPPIREDPPGVRATLRRVEKPDLHWYRGLFHRVGDAFLWFSRLVMDDAALRAILDDPLVEVYAVDRDGAEEGMLELDFRVPGECEITYFALTEKLVGTGTGRWLMNRALGIAWARPLRRMWVHTCTLDHPNAVAFYVRSGFRPFKRQIEIADDPRATGVVPAGAAPHVPVL